MRARERRFLAHPRSPMHGTHEDMRGTHGGSGSGMGFAGARRGPRGMRLAHGWVASMAGVRHNSATIEAHGWGVAVGIVSTRRRTELAFIRPSAGNTSGIMSPATL